MDFDIYSFFEGAKQWLFLHGLQILLAFVVLIVTLRVYRSFIGGLVNRYQERSLKGLSDNERAGMEKRMDTIRGLLRQTGKIVIWVTFLFVILSELGINIAPLIASAGILGLAIGFGSQELVKDIISGFFNLWENLIRIGDVVTINGTSGTVEKVSLRTTSLRDASGNFHVFRNGAIGTLTNHTKIWSAIVIDIGVSYDSDLKKVFSILKEVGDQMQNDPNFKNKIQEEINVLGLNNFGDSSLDLRVKLVTSPGEQWGIGREYRLRIKEAFDENGIEIPFPQRVVHGPKGS